MCGRSKPIVPLLLPFWAMDQSRPGSEYLGGDSSAVPDHLKNAHQIQSTEFAFAAILGAGSVVTWGALEEEEEEELLWRLFSLHQAVIAAMSSSKSDSVAFLQSSFTQHPQNASPGNHWESRPVSGFAVKDLWVRCGLLACGFSSKVSGSSLNH